MQEVWGSNPHSSTQGQRKFSNSSYRLLPALVARWVAEVDQQAFGLAPVDEAVAIKAGVAGPGLSECWRGRTAAFTPTLCGPPAQAGRSYLSRFLQGTGEARYRRPSDRLTARSLLPESLRDLASAWSLFSVGTGDSCGTEEIASQKRLSSAAQQSRRLSGVTCK